MSVSIAFTNQLVSQLVFAVVAGFCGGDDIVCPCVCVCVCNVLVHALSSQTHKIFYCICLFLGYLKTNPGSLWCILQQVKLSEANCQMLRCVIGHLFPSMPAPFSLLLLSNWNQHPFFFPQIKYTAFKFSNFLSPFHLS